MNESLIKSQIERVLSDYRIDYRQQGIDAMFDTWKSRKGKLYDLLSKHPLWSEDDMAIVIPDFAVYRAKDEVGYFDAMNNLISYTYPTAVELKGGNPYDEGVNHTQRTLYLLRDIAYDTAPIFDKDSAVRFKAWMHNNIDANDESGVQRIREGQRASRALGKVFAYLGMDKVTGWADDDNGAHRKRKYPDHVDYNVQSAAAFDAINPIEGMPRIVVLSIHPCDYLLMSHGTGWRSCHYIDGNCYQSGTLSYMADDVSMVFYTLSPKRQKQDLFYEPKISRQMYHFEAPYIGADGIEYGGTLLQNRLYPQDCTDGINNVKYRNIVQDILATCCGEPNLWVTSAHDDEEAFNYCHKGDYSHAYVDWFEYYHSQSLSRFKRIPHWSDLTIGTAGICPQCGGEIYDVDECEMACEDCCSSVGYCDCCGSRVHEDDLTQVANGNYVCNHCLDRNYTYCERCNEWVDNDTIVFVINSRGREEAWCNDCAEDAYYCEDCDRYFTERAAEDGSYIDGIWYCHECAEARMAEEENEKDGDC